MKTRLSRAVAPWLVATLAGCGGGDSSVETPPVGPWFAPACAVVASSRLTYTTDEGYTRAPRTGEITPDGPSPMAVLENRGGTIFALSALKTILRSTDAGCKWAKVGELPVASYELAAGSTEPVYAWGYDRIFSITPSGAVIPLPRAFAPRGFAVDRADSQHVRSMTTEFYTGSQLVASMDGGNNWAPVGNVLPSPSVPQYGGGTSPDRPDLLAVFDPADLDHVIVPYDRSGAFVTFDGGLNWTQSTGFEGFTNRGLLAAFGADGATVWIEVAERNEQLLYQGGGLYHSVDGGLTFVKVATPDDYQFISSVGLRPHPANPDVLYFFSYASTYKYDASLGQLEEHVPNFAIAENLEARIAGAAFNPADPSIMYLGLTVPDYGVAFPHD
ncbi:MAG: WD40/YVTN/BNR-like repeat-containing protein [Gammaproteobacteria bacterium]